MKTTRLTELIINLLFIILSLFIYLFFYFLLFICHFKFISAPFSYIYFLFWPFSFLYFCDSKKSSRILINISNVIPTGLKILRKEHLDHLKYRETSGRFCLCCCVNLCQLQFYRFSWNNCIWTSSKLLKFQWTTSPVEERHGIFIIVVIWRHHYHYHGRPHHHHCNQQDN